MLLRPLFQPTSELVAYTSLVCRYSGGDSRLSELANERYTAAVESWAESHRRGLTSSVAASHASVCPKRVGTAGESPRASMGGNITVIGCSTPLPMPKNCDLGTTWKFVRI